MSQTSYMSRCLRSLFLHRLRTLLSTLGVLFGVMAVVTMLAIGEGTKREILQQIEQLGMNSIIVRTLNLTENQSIRAQEMGSAPLNPDHAAAIQKGPSIRDVAPMKVIEAALVGGNAEVAPEVLAVTSPFSRAKGLSVGEGRFLCDHDCTRRELVCVLGDEVAKSLGASGHVGGHVQLEQQLFRVVGILKPKQPSQGEQTGLALRNFNKAVLIPLGSDMALPQKVRPRGDALSEITLQIAASREVEPAARFVQQALKKSHSSLENYEIIIPQELFAQAYRARRMFNLVLGCIAGISLLVGGIGIMNIMLATVSERTREIGILRAVGATRRDIARQFLIESLLLASFGAALGVLGGGTLALMIGLLAGWKTVITGWSVFIAVGMAMIAGILSGVYPAIRAASLHPIDALRQR